MKHGINFPINNVTVPDTPMVKYESTFENGLLQSFALNITEKVRPVTSTYNVMLTMFCDRYRMVGCSILWIIKPVTPRAQPEGEGLYHNAHAYHVTSDIYPDWSVFTGDYNCLEEYFSHNTPVS